MPEQHWASPVHAVPIWLHTLDEQVPATQLTEQHSPEFAQAAPAPLQNAPEVHSPATQFAEQHCESCVQLPLSATQAG